MTIPFKFHHRPVALKDILSEKAPFRITTNRSTDDLVGALSRAGLINPPVLTSQENGYVVVCGHRRVDAARRLSWETIPARILSDPDDPLTCSCLSISENSIERPLNLIETSRALSLLGSFIPDAAERFRVAGDLGLPNSLSLIEKIEPLCRLPQTIQDGILSGGIALPSVLMLSGWPPETADLLSELLIRLKLSLSKQKELIVIIQEISLREGCSMEDVIRSEQIQDILRHPDMDLPRKAGLIRDHLKRRRFPTISKSMDSFEKLKSLLSLGEKVSLKPPPGFEGRDYSIAFSFSNIAELNLHKQTLDRLVRDERTQTLFDSETGKQG